MTLSKSEIPWVLNPDGTRGYTCNVVRGCTPAGEGCRNCWARDMHRRFHKTPFGDVAMRPSRLFALRNVLLSRKSPCTVFLNSMSDLWHATVSEEFQDEVFATMSLCDHHRFILLTKRWGPMRAYMTHPNRRFFLEGMCEKLMNQKDPELAGIPSSTAPWPPPNLWLGASASTQAEFESAVESLSKTPAAVRFLSLEPLLEQMDIWGDIGDGAIQWVIVGCESGRGRRPCKTEWVADIVAQCQKAEVPVFVKQLDRPGGLCGKCVTDMDQFPKPLQVREFPKA